ncbi:MAG: glycosyltransferase 61 family protein [Alphaproteobacteria bacterium]
MKYRAFLERLHRQAAPELYLEIGVRHGHSLALARCRSFAIDPDYAITEELNGHVRLFRCTSDAFFARPDVEALFQRRKVDLAFIDGNHLFENAIADFLNVERFAAPGAIVVIDDVLPRNAAEARRTRTTTEWAGDVWRVLPFLARHRPDLLLLPIDASPTGLLLVGNLAPGRAPCAAIGQAVAESMAEPPPTPDDAIIRRHGAVPASDLVRSGLLRGIRELTGDALRAAVRARFPRLLLPGFLGPLSEAPLPPAGAGVGDHRIAVHPPLRIEPRPDLVAELGAAAAHVEQQVPALERSIPDTWVGRDMHCPPLGVEVLSGALVFGGTIRKHGDGVHIGGQTIVTAAGALAPASFGIMDGVRTLPADLMTPATPPAAGHRYIGFRSVEELAGAYYLVGNVHRHFGHMLLEGLSRLWALDEIARREKDLRFLVFEPTLALHAATLLERAGVPRDAIVHAPPAARVERLYAPDAAIATHSWLSPVLRPVWDRIAARPAAGRPPTGRYYLSRRSTANRPLENEEEIEAIFAAHGYTVVEPERLGIEEQLALAAGAASLAGCVGSQLYLAMFQPQGGRNVVLAPRNFYLRDDFLIAQTLGHRISLAFGSELDHEQPKNLRAWRCDPAAASAAVGRAVAG